MVASKEIKTPSMTIPFLPNVSEKAKENFRISLNRVTLANVLEAVHVNEKIQMAGRTRRRLVTMRFEFLPRKNYKDKYAITPAGILNYFERTFIHKKFLVVLSAVMKDKKITIEKNTDKKGTRSRKNDEDADEDANVNPDKTMDQVEKGGFGEGHASSDEEELADDADATEARKKQRQQDQDFTEELSDEEVELGRNLDMELGDEPLDDMDIPDFESEKPRLMKIKNEKDEGIEDDLASDDDEIDEKKLMDKSLIEKRNMDTREAQMRKTQVLNLVSDKGGSANVVDYMYDTEKELWCELTLAFSVARKTVDMSNVIKKSAEKAVIREVKNISRAFLIKNEKNEFVLTTEGANIEAMFSYERILNLKKLHCNNIHDMARYYGVEAANKTIVHEIVNVFGAYGIDVNPRHLSLIADYMTFDGTYKPFNR